MKRIPHILVLTVVLSLVFGSSVVWAQQGDISFTAAVDRTTISTDDRLTLTLTLHGPVQTVPEPSLPPLEGFEVYSSGRSQNIAIVNGQVSTSVSFRYTLRPTREGQLTIGPAEIEIDGHLYTSEPIAVEVVQGRVPTPTPIALATAPAGESRQAAAPPASMDSQDLFVMTQTDKQEAYPGEQVTLSFLFFQGTDLFGSDLSYTPPETPGFWSEDLPPDQKYYQHVGQRRYLVQELRTALFPTAVGEQTIGPAGLVVSDFFKRYPLQSQPLRVNVRPLPEEGKPPEFNGAVGQYEVQAYVDKTDTAANEPVTLSVLVQGAGNIASLPAPNWPEIDNARTYDGETQTNISKANYTVQGERRFDRLVVPKQAGELVIPPIRYAFFDPGSEQYLVAETSATHISVRPGDPEEPSGSILPVDKQDLSIVGHDIRHIKAAPDVLYTHRTPLYRSVLFWFTWTFPPLIVAGAFVYYLSQRRLREDVAYARHRRSRGEARKRLRTANRLMNNSDPDAFYAEVSRALREYLGARTNSSAAGLTANGIRSALEERGADEELIQQVILCCDAGDMGRFAPGAGTPEDMARLLEATESAIAKLEGIRWNGR